MRTLNPTEVSKLGDLFRGLGWPLSENGKATERFDAFVATLAELDPQEAELILTITNDFFHHDTGLYSASMRRLAEMIDNNLGQPGRTLIGLPLMKPSDVGKPKSGGMATYLLRLEMEQLARRRNWT